MTRLALSRSSRHCPWTATNAICLLITLMLGGCAGTTPGESASIEDGAGSDDAVSSDVGDDATQDDTTADSDGPAEDVEVDIQPLDTTAPDTRPEDATVDDATPDAPDSVDDAVDPCPAGDAPLGCACIEDGECGSNYCLQRGPADYVCSRFCAGPEDECDHPSIDFQCRVVENDVGDLVRLCAPPTSSQCLPCPEGQCASLGSACTPLDDGLFCLERCEGDEFCRTGERCDEVDGRLVCVPPENICSGCLDNDSDLHGVGTECAGLDCNDDAPDVYEGAAELCDGEDNDCDGFIDELFDTTTDPENCGGCGIVCDGPNLATQACADGEECFVCRDGNCLCAEGWADCDGDLTNGCETDLRNDNRCGGCATFEDAPGAACGTCGTGTLTCDGTDALRCEADLGGAAQNACGGCSSLDNAPGTACGACGGGAYACADGGEGTDCVDGDTGLNACGGCAALGGVPGAACGTCDTGVLSCDGEDALACVGDQGELARNACGGCTTLSLTPGAACGTCNSGTVVCANEEAAACDGDAGGAVQNACGGCLDLANPPGTACGTCGTGVYVCDGTGELTVCLGGDGGLVSLYPDTDEDGFGDDRLPPEMACANADGFANNNLDCDDGDTLINPVADEIPGDEVDQNCDGEELCFIDADEDGYHADVVIPSENLSCRDGDEASDDIEGGDCYDDDSRWNPGYDRDLVGDGIDNDCDGFESCYGDEDNDGYRTNTGTVLSVDMDCDDAELGEALEDMLSGDCDDSLDTRNPGLREACDGIDNDCRNTNVPDGPLIGSTVCADEEVCITPGECGFGPGVVWRALAWANPYSLVLAGGKAFLFTFERQFNTEDGFTVGDGDDHVGAMTTIDVVSGTTVNTTTITTTGAWTTTVEVEDNGNLWVAGSGAANDSVLGQSSSAAAWGWYFSHDPTGGTFTIPTLLPFLPVYSAYAPPGGPVLAVVYATQDTTQFGFDFRGGDYYLLAIDRSETEVVRQLGRGSQRLRTARVAGAGSRYFVFEWCDTECEHLGGLTGGYISAASTSDHAIQWTSTNFGDVRGLFSTANSVFVVTSTGGARIPSDGGEAVNFNSRIQAEGGGLILGSDSNRRDVFAYDDQGINAFRVRANYVSAIALADDVLGIASYLDNRNLQIEFRTR